MALIQMRAETLGRIDEALARLEAGDYGHCHSCGEEIAGSRLRALPFAVRCRDCEALDEAERHRARAAQRRGSAPFMDPTGSRDSNFYDISGKLPHNTDIVVFTCKLMPCPQRRIAELSLRWVEARMRILVVEDDRKVAGFIQRGLEQEGYAVDVLHDGSDAGEQAHLDYDGVVLDLMLPGRSGFQVLRDIRARKATAGADSHREGLARGAGDRPRQRRRRLHGQAVRAGRAVGAPARAAPARHAARDGLRVADLEMDTMRRTVSRGGRPIDLKPKEYALLEFLMRNSDRPVTRSLIIEHVWDIHFDSVSNVVEVHINSLRNKIDRGFGVPLIHTIRGVGYMLTDKPA